MPRLHHPESREAWLQLRRAFVTSTESPALFGLSPYLTATELHYIKTGELSDTFTENERMRVGRLIEQAICAMVAEDRGWSLRAANYFAEHSALPRMGSSFDYEIVAHERGPGILEIKNVDYIVWRDAWTDDDGNVEAPPHIEIQLQHQLEVMNRSWGVIAVLVGGNTLKIIERARDPEMGAMIVDRTRRFWADVDAGNKPEWNFADDAEVIGQLYGRAGGEAYDARGNERVSELMRAVKQAIADEKEAGERKEAAKAELFVLVGEADRVIADIGTIATSRTKDSPPILITESMVGEEIGGRKGYRQCRVNIAKEHR